MGAGNLGPHRSKGRLNDPQKGPMNEEVLAVGMPGGQARGKIPQRRDEEEQGKDNDENKRGKLGKHRKGDGGDEGGKPGGRSKRDDGENEHESDEKGGASERIRREATVTKLTVSTWSVRTDVRDRGWPGATVQETRGAPTQARSAESNRRDPGDEESMCGEAVIVRAIGAAPCKILNRDDHGDGLV